MKILVIPFERHPSDHSFLEEMFAHPKAPYESVFLMRSKESSTEELLSWHASRVYVFPERSANPLIRSLQKYFMDLRYLPMMLRVLMRERPDVVLIRDLTFPLLLAQIFRLFLPMAIVYQRSFPYEFSWFDPRRVQNYRFPALWKLCRTLESALLHRLLHWTDAVLTISTYMKQELIEQDLLDEEKLHPFGLGIDEEQIRSLWNDGPPADADEIRMIYVGTLASARRIDILLQALASVLADEPARPFHVDFIGGTPQEVESLQSLADELGLRETVNFLGRQPRAELYSHMARCHCGLVYIPADPRFWISFPTKLVESLALGMPCVATDTARTNLELAARTHAVVISGADAESFARGIQAFLDDPHSHARAARRSREEILSLYGYHPMRARLAEICRDALPQESPL